MVRGGQDFRGQFPRGGRDQISRRSQDSKLLKRYFNIKPVKPRIMNTWDVSVVSKFLFTLYPLPELSLKHVQLTYKLTALIALTTAARAHTISTLDIKKKVFFINMFFKYTSF